MPQVFSFSRKGPYSIHQDILVLSYFRRVSVKMISKLIRLNYSPTGWFYKSYIEFSVVVLFCFS